MPVELAEPVVPASTQALSFARTVDRRLLHRYNLSVVFLTDLHRSGQSEFVAAALLPARHPHYTSHTGAAGRIPDPMLLLECCRQAETYAAHVLFDVDLETRFVLRSWSATFDLDRMADLQHGQLELVIAATTAGARRVAERLRALDYDMRLLVTGQQVGRVRMSVAYVPPDAYAVLRNRGRDQPPPSSHARPAVITGRPVDPHRVGRVHATDTVLLDAAASHGRVSAILRLPLENPSLFDHPQDHVPGMVLVEAARQLATLATARWGAGAPDRGVMTAMDGSFSAYADLDELITLTARRAGDDGSAVEVTVQQRGADVARVRVDLRRVPGRHQAGGVA